jgi:hypothetical protein
MSDEDSDLVRTAVALHNWCRQQRAPKGGVPLKRRAERLLEEALAQIRADGFIADESRGKLLASVAFLSEYLDMIR